MTSALLNCKSFVPPLLELQLSPPEETRDSHEWHEDKQFSL
jgi:hypothetical protein